MKMIWPCLFLLPLFFLTALPDSTNAQEPLAIITNVTGEAFVKSDTSKSWQKAETKTLLYYGDSLKTKKSSSVTILYQNSIKKALASNEIYELYHYDGPKESPSWLTQIWNYLILNKEDLTPIGASRGEEAVLLYPRSGKLQSRRPAIALTSGFDHKLHRIRIFESKSQKLVWEIISQDTIIRYAESAPPLEDGRKYLIQLLEQGQYFTKPQNQGTFIIVSEQERNSMKSLQSRIYTEFNSEDSLDLTVDFLLASIYFKNSYYTDAYLQIQEALSKQPDNRAMKLILLDWCRAVGLNLLIDPLIKELKQ